jgi:hypothetical protein
MRSGLKLDLDLDKYIRENSSSSRTKQTDGRGAGG